MTLLHLAVENNRIKMVECLLDQEADINLQDDNEVILHTRMIMNFTYQDDNEVILHTNAVDYIELAGRYCPIVHLLCCLKI